MAVDVYISEEKIKKRVEELAAEISKDYEGQEIFVLGVLQGSFVFCADLIRKITRPIEIDFISASSYGAGTTSSGEVKISYDVSQSLKGKHVLIVEDIVDTGLTLTKLIEHLKKKEPASLKLASLLFKPARLEHKVDIDYLAFEIEDKFVIGYGLDFDARFRELPYIGIYSHD